MSLFNTGSTLTGITLKTSFVADIDLSKHKVDNLPLSGHYRWYQDVTIGDYHTATNVPIRCVSNKTLDKSESPKDGDGLLGIPLLKRYNIIADYKNNVLYLQPIKNTYIE